MSGGAGETPLTSQEKSRVVALSASIAGLSLFLYFLDHFVIGRFDPSYLLVWTLQAAEVKSGSPINFPVIACGAWCVAWILSSIDAIRDPGRIRVALFSSIVILAGAILVFAVNQMARNYLFSPRMSGL